MQFWYTEQLRNYRLQFIRAFSNFYVQTGPDSSGAVTLSQVPCRYGDVSRIAATIVAGNSENKVPPVPFITCTVTGLAMNASRRQDPNFVGTIQVTEREYDAENNRYLQNQGNKYTIQRYMPIPYDLTMQVDIWSNNLQIKEQILEQILTLYNPSIEIQTSNSNLDWTVISLIELEEIAWSSRSIPIGTDNPIEVTTLTFKVPIWINPPAKVKKQKLIEQIITNVISGIKEVPEQWDWSEYEFFSRKITTPGDFDIALSWTGSSYSVSLTGSNGDPSDPDGRPTITTGKHNPTMTAGTSFAYNGITINIADPSLEGVVSACRAALAGTKYQCQIYNFDQIQFTNWTAGDNVFANVVGQPVQDMGLLPTSYPGGNLSWPRLLEVYGNIKPYAAYGTNASQLRIITDIEDSDLDIVGWIDLDPVDQNLLTWTMDQQSLPGTTLAAINAIVDPSKVGPGYGLPPAVTGQRYLLLSAPTQSSTSWGDFSSTAVNGNDIVEFDGQRWNVSFDSVANVGTKQYVINQFNGKLLSCKSGEWSEYISRSYAHGQWRFSL